MHLTQANLRKNNKKQTVPHTSANKPSCDYIPIEQLTSFQATSLLLLSFFFFLTQCFHSHLQIKNDSFATWGPRGRGTAGFLELLRLMTRLRNQIAESSGDPNLAECLERWNNSVWCTSTSSLSEPVPAEPLLSTRCQAPCRSLCPTSERIFS